MHSRLLSALLRLLPMSAYQSLDNPVQLNRLPDHSRVEFDYPVFQDPPDAARRKTTVLIFLVALAAPAMAWINAYYPISFLHGGLTTVALLAATAFVIMGAVGPRWPLASYALAVLAIPILAELVVDESYILAAAVPALIGTFLLSDRLGTLFLYLKTAAPIPRPRSLQARAIWNRRWIAFLRPLRGAEGYPLNFLLFSFPVLLAVQQASSTILEQNELLRLGGLFLTIIAAAMLWPLILEGLLAPIYGRRPYGPRRLGRAFWHALIEWCTYNRLNTQGVGIHHSPVGACTWRRRLVIGVILAWACVWTSPIIVRSLNSRIFDALVRIAPRLAHFEKNFEPEQILEDAHNQTVFDRAKAVPELTDAERTMLKRMTSERAQAYMEERHRLHLEERDNQRHHQESQAKMGKSASYVLRFAKGFGKVAFSILVPTLGTALVCLSLVFGASARGLAGAEDLCGHQPRTRILSSDNWELLVERLRASQDACEKNSLFLGTNMRDDTPVLVPREVFAEHAHILGDSGSGKTSIGLMPLICQLMRHGDCSVVVIDLKADDQALFETLRQEAAALDSRVRQNNPQSGGYPCRWFTTTLDRSSYIFNPLTQRVMPRLADYQRTDILTAALGLQYGTEYGRKFFGDSNYDLLQYAIGKNPNLQSFADLADVLAGAERFPLDKETKKAATHVRSSVRRMARCQPLNGCRNAGTPQTALDQAIDFSDVFRQPQALYFALPPSSGVANTAEIARIAVYSLLAAAQMHEGRRTQVFLVIDEFQRIVSNNLGLFLQTARSMDIGVILSNQSLDDLETADANLIPAVRTNTRFRQVFAAGNRTDILDLRDTAGEAMVGLRSWNLLPALFDEGRVQSVSVRETPVSRLMLNDILLATDAFGRNIVSVRRGAGYAQFGGMPFIMDSVHHLSFQRFQERRATPWPPPQEGTIVGTRVDSASEPAAGGPSGRVARVLDDSPPADDTDADPEDSDGGDPDSDPDFAAGLPDNPLTALFEEQQARRAARRKRRKREEQERPNNPSPSSQPGDLFP